MQIALQAVERSIRAVEDEIREVKRQLTSEKDPEERRYLRKEEEHLRKEKEQLREEKLLLLKSHGTGRSVLTAAQVLTESLPVVDTFINDTREYIKQLGSVPTVAGKPCLLIADLGTTFLTQPADLGKMLDTHSPVVSVVGTSGSGKTRTLLELLSTRYGLYFVADTVNNFGPGDLADLKRLVLQDVPDDLRPALAQSVVQAAVLARLFLLKRCLDVNFTEREWLLLQLLGSRTPGQADVCMDLMRSLLEKLKGLGVQRRQAALESEIGEQWKQLKALGLPDVVIVLDEAQALFEILQGQFKPAVGGTGMRSSFHQVYTALKQPSTAVPTKLIVSATGLAVQREMDVSGTVAKQMLSGPAFSSFGRFRDTGDMLAYISKYVKLDEPVNEELLQRFVGRYRPLALAVEDFLEEQGKEQGSINDSLEKIRRRLTQEDAKNSYNQILKRIQVQPRIHNVELISLCRMIYLTSMYSVNYLCTRKEEVELIHMGLAYVHSVDVGGGEFGLNGMIDEPLVFEALEYYFREDRSMLHIMNMVNAQSAGFHLELVVAEELCNMFLVEKFSDHDIFKDGDGGDHLPDIFRQKISLSSKDSLPFLCTTALTSYLHGGTKKAKMLNPEFLAGPDLVLPLKTEDNRELSMLVQLRLVNFLDTKKFEQGIATTNPEFIFRSRKAAKLKTEFNEKVGNKWWKNAVIRLIIVYPAVFKSTPMPPTTEIIPARNGIGPQVKIIVHAGNATRIFSKRLLDFLDLFKGFKIGEPESMALSVIDCKLALELHRVLNGRQKRKRDYSNDFVDAEDLWGGDDGMELDL